MKKWLTKLLFDWVFVLLYRLLQGLLNLVHFVESFFDVFAGTAKVYYKGDTTFLIDIFFGHTAVTNAFWAMALIAIALAFAFAIINLSRKVTDVTGHVKQTVGDIMGNFFRCLLIIVMINAVTVATVNMANVLLDRINYALKNAAVLDQTPGDKEFNEQEIAAMTRILATVGNYSVNPASDSRYNINSCFNELRPDLLSLYVNGFFDYDYPMDANGHYTWQGALQLIAVSADLTQDLPLDVYNNEVAEAIKTVSKELTTYKGFAPQKTAKRTLADSITTDNVIFLICGMDAAENAQYRTGRFDDALRKDYINGTKSYNNLNQVRKDFDIWEMDYLVGYISSFVMVIILSICIFTFIVRMFNLMLLYITAPLFASSMPLDDGSKWQSWTQAFVIQLFSGFGLVIAMRLYLIVIPIVLSSDLVFFAGDSFGNAVMNHMAQLMMILGGAWAVLQSGSVITGILAGNPGMAAIQQEGLMGSMVTRWAMSAPRAALGAARSIGGKTVGGVRALAGARERAEARQDQKANRLAARANRKQNQADALQRKADRELASGHQHRAGRAQDRANRMQRGADRAAGRSNRYSDKHGTEARPEARTPRPAGVSRGYWEKQTNHSGDVKSSENRPLPPGRSGGIGTDTGSGFRTAAVVSGARYGETANGGDAGTGQMMNNMFGNANRAAARYDRAGAATDSQGHMMNSMFSNAERAAARSSAAAEPNMTGHMMQNMFHGAEKEAAAQNRATPGRDYTGHMMGTMFRGAEREASARDTGGTATGGTAGGTPSARANDGGVVGGAGGGNIARNTANRTSVAGDISGTSGGGTVRSSRADSTGSSGGSYNIPAPSGTSGGTMQQRVTNNSGSGNTYSSAPPSGVSGTVQNITVNNAGGNSGSSSYSRPASGGTSGGRNAAPPPPQTVNRPAPPSRPAPQDTGKPNVVLGEQDDGGRKRGNK